MYVRLVSGEPHPRAWQDYERLIIRSAEDPNIVLALRPGAWQEYERQFLRLADDADDDINFDGADWSLDWERI